MFRPLTDLEKKAAQQDMYQFIIESRYETFRVIRRNFRNVMILSIGFAWYLNNWWPLLAGIIFSFMSAWYTSIKWSKYVYEVVGVSEEDAIACWKQHQLSTHEKR